MKLSVVERAMLNAVDSVPPVPLVDDSLAIAISPTRGAQLARVVKNVGYSGSRVLVRIGGPMNYIEETPDVLTDAKPFLVVDHAIKLVEQFRAKLKIAEKQRDEALRELELLRARYSESRIH